MTVLWILLAFTASTGTNDNASISKKKDDISTEKILPTYMRGVKRNLTLNRQWSQILFEDFESGIPGNWTVIDGNSDGYTWTTGITGDLSSYAPPDSGTAYAYYSDDDAGSGAPQSTNEDLMSPAFEAINYDSLSVIYAYGWNDIGSYDEYGVFFRTNSGGIWSSWDTLLIYGSDASGWDTLTVSVAADSAQFMWKYWETTQAWEWAAGVDNIKILAHLAGGGMYDIGITSLDSPPELMDVHTPYPVMATFKNFGDSTMTFDAHAEITDTSGTPSYFSKDSLNITLMPDSIIQINFGNWTMTDIGTYKYSASTMTPDSNSGNDIQTRTLMADIDFSTDSLISPPANCKKDTAYNVIVEFSNNGLVDTTVDLHVNIDFEGTPIFTADSTGVPIPAGNSLIVDFGSVTFTNFGTFTYMANSYSPFDLDHANDTLSTMGDVNPWQIVTDMPDNLMDHAIVFDGSDVFVLGGYNGSSSSQGVYKYSPGSRGVWSLCDSMPIDLCMYDARALGDTIYVPGGYSYTTGSQIDTLLKYSISGDNWTMGPGTGENVWFFACEAANGKIYKIGGYDNVAGTMVSSTWEYDPATGSWTQKTNMPIATELAATWVRNDSIYIAGGVDGATSTYYNQVQIYDAANDTWTVDSTFFAHLPTKRWGAGTAFYKDTVFVMGGVGASGSVRDSVLYYAYDGPNTWQLYPAILNPVYRTEGVGVDGIGGGFDGVYLFGGSSGGFTPQSYVQARVVPSGVGEENRENVKVEYLSIPRSIALNKIRFSYRGNKSANILVRDIAGRVIREYSDVKPGSILNFGDGNAAGIYFISVKGQTECKKVTLIR